MATSITHTQTRSIVSGSFRVLDTVTATSGIAPQVFVFLTADDSFSRVATASDMATVPATKAAAVAATSAYYRLATVQIDWPLLANAIDFASTVKDRIKALAVEYDISANLFIGAETLTVTQ